VNQIASEGAMDSITVECTLCKCRKNVLREILKNLRCSNEFFVFRKTKQVRQKNSQNAAKLGKQKIYV
jgi:hypothetical protein